MEAPSSPGQRIIVVGVDGSSSSVAALQLATRMVPLMGDVVHAVSVWQYPLVFGMYTPIDWNYEELAEGALEQALKDAFPGDASYKVEPRVVHGAPAEVLIEESRVASMVVVGSRGQGGFSGLLLGSVSAAVAERAGCPVLIAHGAVQLPEGQSNTLTAVEVSA